MNAILPKQRLAAAIVAVFIGLGSGFSAAAAESRTLNALFIGNSFTGRHNLSQVVKAMASAYVEYAPKFAALIKAQGGRVVLYETTPDTQNATPLTTAPDRAPIVAKARTIVALARRIDATVVPMSMVALHCQTVRPDLTLRFVNDGHLNQTMAYLTACTFQAALFGRSPEGLPVDTVTDIRFFDATHKDQDRDGKPITRTFSVKERLDLQQIAWEGFQEFRKISQSVDATKPTTAPATSSPGEVRR